ncbi:MAG TPA: DUF4349 domain-containing protein [Gemmatimonadaceae bacterium]|jgi:hypothetical protein
MKAALMAVIALGLVACGDGGTPADSLSVNGPVSTGNAAVAAKALSEQRVARVRGGIAGGFVSASAAMNASPRADFGQPVANDVIVAGSADDPPQNLSFPPEATGAPAMVIRTGQAFVEVGKLDPAVLRVRQLAAQVGGYITNSSISGGHDQIRQATLEIKIPAQRYDEAVSSLSALGKVETVNTNAEDVGEEFVDVTARVANSRRLEERLLNLLGNRTGKLDEVLRVERELARVREEIERYEGRLRFLGSRVAMSTLTITAHEPAPLLGDGPGANPIAAAFRRAWRNFVALVAAFIASLGVVIPLAAICAAGLIGYRRWRPWRVSA